jgi:hypothetical protein
MSEALPQSDPDSLAESFVNFVVQIRIESRQASPMDLLAGFEIRPETIRASQASGAPGEPGDRSQCVWLVSGQESRPAVFSLDEMVAQIEAHLQPLAARLDQWEEVRKACDRLCVICSVKSSGKIANVTLPPRILGIVAQLGFEFHLTFGTRAVWSRSWSGDVLSGDA